MVYAAPPPNTTTPTVSDQVQDDGEATTTISAIHHDVLLTHIFSRLNGATLASTSCASSELHSISTQQNLWSDICHNTWHSTLDSRIQNLISTFPNTHRSFFSDSFPLLSHYPPPKSNQINPHHPSIPTPPHEIISAVDLHYKNKLIFSKVEETKTQSDWFRSSPFQIDLLDPKDVIPTTINHNKDLFQGLTENLTLSWIIVDPIGRRAANLSSWRPVSVQRHWLSEEVQVRFVTVLGGNSKTTTEFVQCGILVAFGGYEDGNIQVKEVSLNVEDMDGISLNGKDSLEILQLAIGCGERKKGCMEERKEKYEEYLKMKKEREEEKLRKERKLDFMCIGVVASVFTVFLMVVLFVPTKAGDLSHSARSMINEF